MAANKNEKTIFVVTDTYHIILGSFTTKKKAEQFQKIVGRSTFIERVILE